MIDFLEILAKYNGLVVSLVGVGFFGIFRQMFHALKKRNEDISSVLGKTNALIAMHKETDERLKVLEEQGELRRRASLASLHDRIYSFCELVLKRGAITLKELDNLEYLWESYREQGGNGTGEVMVQRTKDLPIISEKELENSEKPNL